MPSFKCYSAAATKASPATATLDHAETRYAYHNLHSAAAQARNSRGVRAAPSASPPCMCLFACACPCLSVVCGGGVSVVPAWESGGTESERVREWLASRSEGRFKGNNAGTWWTCPNFSFIPSASPSSSPPLPSLPFSFSSDFFLVNFSLHTSFSLILLSHFPLLTLSLLPSHYSSFLSLTPLPLSLLLSVNFNHSSIESFDRQWERNSRRVQSFLHSHSSLSLLSPITKC